METGKYGLWIGNNSANLKLEAFINVNQDVVLEQTQKLEALVELSEKWKASKNVKAAEKQLEKVEMLISHHTV